uniref:Sensory neuron membrane protein 1 n=1 Tax=Aulacocentrum confusum TaxID=2767324 RepID=A0A7G8Z9J2_9HYME|nr:sensory neuron membrane protein 1 [Aulacocentrum confusum]
MKTPPELQQFKKCIVFFMVAIVCGATTYAIYAIDPIELIFQWKLTMTPTSTVFIMWRKPPVDVFLNVYVFNITNSEEFMRGDEKLRVQEIGPYVYQELLENTNVVWHDNGTISYTPLRTVIFRRDMSIGDPENDLVMVTNIPLLGVASALYDAGFFVNYPLAQIANALDSKPILNMSVYQYLWGYDDPLVRLASGIVPNFINFRQFGLLDRMYDEGVNTINMNIWKTDNIQTERERYLSIETYNGSPGLRHWGYVDELKNETHSENTVCNRIKGGTEGTLFPTRIDKHDVFRVFRKAFCRPLPIVFTKEVSTRYGLPGWEYTFAKNFLDPPGMNPENECYCRKMKKCLKKGLSDLTPCYYNIPAAISLPHFLDADPSLLEDIDGLEPDPQKHGTKVIIQPSIGMPMDVNSRLQTNLVMQHTRYNPKLEVFNGLVIPLFWTDLSIPNVNPDLVFLSKMLLQVGPIAQTSAICVIAIVGIAMFLFSIIGIFSSLKQQTQRKMDGDRKDSTDLRIPLGYGQYTAIRILPAIKKITSKTDLFS